MNKTLIFCFLCLSPILLSAQSNFDYLKIIGREGEYITVIDVSSANIEYENSYGLRKTIPVSDVEFLEYDGKVTYYKYNKQAHDVFDEYLQRISRNDPEKLLEKGAKVYVPLMYGDTRWQIMGCINTREMLIKDHSKFWKLVDTEYEAEIILYYVAKYDDDDVNHYYVIENRDGETIYKSDDEDFEGGWRADMDESREHVEDLLDNMIGDID